MITSQCRWVPRLTSCGCEERSGTLWHCLRSRRRGSGESHPPSPPGSRTCWSIHCTWTSLLCVCAIPTEAPRSKSRGSAWQAFPEWLQYHLAVNGRLSRSEIVHDIGRGAQQCRGIVIPVGANPGAVQLLDSFDRHLTLKDVVSSFYKDPRFPLVPSLDEIRQVIYDLLQPAGHAGPGTGGWELVGSDGLRLHVDGPKQLAISSIQQQLRRAAMEERKVGEGSE